MTTTQNTTITAGVRAARREAAIEREAVAEGERVTVRQLRKILFQASTADPEMTVADLRRILFETDPDSYALREMRLVTFRG